MLAIKKYIWLLYFSFMLFCSPGYITICDDYDYKKKSCYQISEIISFRNQFQPDQKWKEVGYDLYFHKKITLGILYQERFWFISKLKSQSFLCKYTISTNKNSLLFKKAKGKLEGNRILNHSYWCFDYLGSMLLEFLKINGIQDNSISEILIPHLQIEISIYKEGIYQKKFIRKIQLQNLD